MMVKVAVCKDAFEGEVVKGMLADNGIDCYLQNESMSQIYGGIQAMAINVMVKEEDAEKAKELLESRPEVEPLDSDKPQMKPKSISRILLEALLTSVIIFLLFLFSAWISKDLEHVYNYAFIAGGFFIGYIAIALLYLRRVPKKEK